MDTSIVALAEDVISELRRNALKLSTAESCTGGLIAGALTSVAGSSDSFFGGYVTYDNRAKIEMIGVHPELIADHGAVSREVARAMAEGARKVAGVDIAVSATGIAGPGGGSAEKPVGLVHFGLAGPRGTEHIEKQFGAVGREAVRLESVRTALLMIRDNIQR